MVGCGWLGVGVLGCFWGVLGYGRLVGWVLVVVLGLVGNLGFRVLGGVGIICVWVGWVDWVGCVLLLVGGLVFGGWLVSWFVFF